MEDDQARFIAETGEEAHYWFTVSDFAALSLKYPLDHMLKDMIQLRNQVLATKRASGIKVTKRTPVEVWQEDKTSLRKSINAKCFDCCCGDVNEVKNCTVQVCPLWFVRPGAK